MQVHDLTGEAEADAGTMLFRREEWHEDLVHDIGLDAVAIVMDVDDHSIGIVQGGQDGDTGVIHLFYSINRIKHQVDNYLVNEVRISGDHQVRRKYFVGAGDSQLVDLWQKKLAATVEQLGNMEIAKIRFGDAGKVAVCLHKIQQPKMKELWDNEEDEAWENV